MGRVWAEISNLGKNHFWGKPILTFGASNHPKMHAICPYTHDIHLLMQGILGAILPSHFLLIFLILHAQKSIFGVVQQVGKEHFHFGSLWQLFGSCNAINILRIHGKRRFMFFVVCGGCFFPCEANEHLWKWILAPTAVLTTCPLWF